jgi:amidohydrolase
MNGFRSPGLIFSTSAILSIRAVLSAAAIVLTGVAIVAGPGAAQELRPEADRAAQGWIDGELASVVALYRELHRSPELSLQEFETAARVAGAFQRAGYEVTVGVGDTGVVGVMRNGDGPVVLVRGDMDGLPVSEATGLEYASRVRVKRADGSEVGVMHACGHDVHISNLIGTAQLLAALRDYWSGTLVMLAQPAEEIGRGALAMIEDGLFDRFPRPDYAIALHVDADMAAGTVGMIPGWAAANVDSVDITIHGRGGHGARPHQTIDPIVAAAHFVTSLQTLVSRRVRPGAPAVVTVGSFHGGSKHNIIPDEVELQLTVRSYSDEVRAQLLEGIAQLAEDTCRTFQCPQPPDVRMKDEYTPAVYNDPELADSAARIFGSVIGEPNVMPREPAMGGEDFGRYSRVLEVPGLIYRLGSVDPKLVAAAAEPGGAPLPSLHSSRYAPDPEPTLRTGLRTLSGLALALLAPADVADAD